MDFKEGLKTAVSILEKSGISKEDWTFGGGTALMLYFNHRKSRDIDIFFHNPQFITMLTPRLNDYTYSITDKYTEQSNFLKLYFDDFEIDFIVAPNLTGLKPELKKLDGIEIYVDHPVEIIAKKIYYRPYDIKIRDVIDLAFVHQHFPEMVRIFRKRKIKPDINEIRLSIERLNKTDVKEILKELSLNKPITQEDFKKYLSVFMDFIKRIEEDDPY